MTIFPGFPGGSVGKEFPCSAGDTGEVDSIPESGRSPGGGHGNPLQYFAWRIPWTEASWQVTIHRATKSQRWLKRLSMHEHPVFQVPFVFFLYWMVLTLFSKISWQYIYIYFCTLNSIPMMCMSILMPILHYLNDCSFMVSFEIEKRESSDFLFSIALMVNLITEIDHFWDIPDFLLRNRNDSTNIAIRKNKAILCSYLVS